MGWDSLIAQAEMKNEQGEVFAIEQICRTPDGIYYRRRITAQVEHIIADHDCITNPPPFGESRSATS